MNSSNTRSAILVTISIVVCYFIIFATLELNFFAFGFNKGLTFTKLQALRIIFLSSFTLLGIIFSVLYEQTEKANDKNFNFFAILKESYTAKQAWLAILTSPIVIISFYKQIQSIDSIPLICMLSFQNGFFFKSILQKARAARKP